MANSETAIALDSVRVLIERHLTDLFGHLDASTGLVEVRKQLHALCVRQAIITASERFPGNDALTVAIEEALISIRQPVAAA